MFICFFLLVSLNALGFPLESKNGKSEFLAIGRPAALKIVGHGAGPSGDLSLQKEGDFYLLSGEVLLDLESFDTGISLRDQHMKEKYLETGKSKNAILKFNQAKLDSEILDKGGEVTLPATLQLRGVEKPTEIKMALTPGSDFVKALSTFQIQISDFQIPIPSFSGITVADLVQIKIETQIAKNNLNTETSVQK